MGGFDSGSTYAEYAPTAALTPFVECYWRHRAREHAPFQILPDGCADLVVDLATQSKATRLVGPMTRPLERIGGTAHVLGIRFRPGGARSLLGRRDLRAIRNSQAPISLWGDERAPQEADIVAALESHLLVASRRLGAYERGGTELARRCFATNLPIAKLAEEVGMSRQHLRRRVVDASGLAPKVLARVGRARRLRELLDGGANAGAAAALSAGYFDQSHMVNEFGALMGVSPGAYAARSS